MDKDFEEFWKAYQPDEIRYPNRKNATYGLWQHRIPAARQAMLDYAKTHPIPKWKNPYFFVQEFPNPEPTFLRGDEKGDLVQVKYDGLYKICTRETAQQFNLEITNPNWNKPWQK